MSHSFHEQFHSSNFHSQRGDSTSTFSKLMEMGGGGVSSKTFC